MDVIEFHPDRDQYAFTFGGVYARPQGAAENDDAAVGRTTRSTCGNLQDPADMPSANWLTRTFVNPQTSPFYVEGRSRAAARCTSPGPQPPARDWGARPAPSPCSAA